MKITKSFQHQTVQCFQFGSRPFKKPKLFSHVYFVDGLLLDTGHSKMRKDIMKTLAPLPVEQIYITHHHEDHSGNIPQLKNQFQCPVYASALCVEMMKKPPPISFPQWLSWGPRSANFDLRPKEHFLETQNHYFQIIPIPGHALDMVALFEEQKGWLFSADLFVSEYIRYFMRPESMAQQIDSIKRILALDFEVLFCSHNPQIQGGKEKLKNKLQFFEDLYGKVARLHHEGHSVASIIKKLKLRRSWYIRILSLGTLSTVNMVKSVIRDEANKGKKANRMDETDAKV